MAENWQFLAYRQSMNEMPSDVLRLLTLLVDSGPMSGKSLFELVGFQHVNGKLDRLVREGFAAGALVAGSRLREFSATEKGLRVVAASKGVRASGKVISPGGTYRSDAPPTWRPGQDDFMAVKSRYD